MDLALVIVNAGIFVATVLAGIIAWNAAKAQANAAKLDAKQAKEDAAAAQMSRNAAVGAAERSAAAAEESAGSSARSADALERHNELFEDATHSSQPWLIERVGAHRFKATNATALNLDFVNIESTPPDHLDLDGELTEVGRGQSFFFGFGGGMTDPASVNIHITWRDPVTRSMGEFFATIP